MQWFSTGGVSGHKFFFPCHEDATQIHSTALRFIYLFTICIYLYIHIDIYIYPLLGCNPPVQEYCYIDLEITSGDNKTESKSNWAARCLNMRPACVCVSFVWSRGFWCWRRTCEEKRKKKLGNICFSKSNCSSSIYHTVLVTVLMSLCGCLFFLFFFLRMTNFTFTHPAEQASLVFSGCIKTGSPSDGQIKQGNYFHWPPFHLRR